MALSKQSAGNGAASGSAVHHVPVTQLAHTEAGSASDYEALPLEVREALDEVLRVLQQVEAVAAAGEALCADNAGDLRAKHAERLFATVANLLDMALSSLPGRLQ